MSEDNVIVGQFGQPVSEPGLAVPAGVVDGSGKPAVNVAAIEDELAQLKKMQSAQFSVFAMATCFQTYLLFRHQLQQISGFSDEAKAAMMQEVMQGMSQLQVPVETLSRDMLNSVVPVLSKMGAYASEQRRKRKKAHDKADRVARSRSIYAGFLDKLVLPRDYMLHVPAAEADKDNVAIELARRWRAEGVRALYLASGDELQRAPNPEEIAAIDPEGWLNAAANSESPLREIRYADVLVCSRPEFLATGEASVNDLKQFGKHVLAPKKIALVLVGAPVLAGLLDAANGRVIAHPRELKLVDGVADGRSVRWLQDGDVCLRDVPLRQKPEDELVVLP